ncbi:coiled-coil domain-containing protein 42 homolog [Morone saxatilis]|uniref:coiled-coil domain-containing protein 42 homolog n=1 Tax=Morone saxatilis TaxID=34816 RepID=UPI0015E239AC|nr:coiled-coil domain-containing protein 42 homolog [Morone saxatilis]
MDNPSHPIYAELRQLRSTFNRRLIQPRASKRFGGSFDQCERSMLITLLQCLCVSRSWPAGAAGAMTGVLRDRTAALFDLRQKRREEQEFNAEKEEREQVLESLKQRTDELHEKIKEVEELYSGFDMFLKDEDADQAAEKAERERKDRLQKEAEIRRLKEKYFNDVRLLMGHLESLLHFKAQLCQRESEAQEQVDQQRKAILTLEDQYHLMRLHKNNQLSQLQTELERTRSEALTWERKWNHIQETAAKKTLLLGQIKMATLNLYGMTEDEVEGEEGVDVNDTDKQLDKVKMFIQDHDDILKQHQTPSHRHNDGQKRKQQKRNKAEKSIATHCKKY